MDDGIQTSINHISDIEKDVSVIVPAEIVKAQYDNVYNTLQRHVNRKGFRKGKVPREILEKSHSSTARQQVDSVLLNMAYYKVVQENGYEAVGSPNIKEYNYELDGSYRLNFYIEVKPDFDPVGYDSLKLKKVSDLNLDDAVNKRLEQLRKVAERNDSEKKFEINDDLAKELGYGTLERMRKSAEKEVKDEVERAVRLNYEEQALNQLYKLNSFNVPKTMLEKQADFIMREIKEKFKYDEEPDDDVKKQMSEIAENQLKRMILLERIFKKEKENIKDVNMDSDAIDRMAKWANVSKSEFLKRNENDMMNLFMNVREQHTVDFILEKAEYIEEEKGEESNE